MKKTVILYGYNGVMGQLIAKELSNSEEWELLYGVSPLTTAESAPCPLVTSLIGLQMRADLLVDFSHPENLDDILAYATAHQVPTLIATTGHTPAQREKMKAAAKNFPLLLSSNTSIGVHLLNKLLAVAAAELGDTFDIEVIEKHHNRKVDAPSGTAETLVKTIESTLSNAVQRQYGRTPESGKRQPNTIGIHSVRGGTIAGEHTVLFAGEDEVIELKHTALSRRLFAVGALSAGSKLQTKAPGFYTMQTL